MITTKAVLDCYRDAPWSTRLHALLRWKLFPFPALIPHVPPKGIYMDIGCGFGLWGLFLALHFPDAQIYGIDPDQDKIWIARQAAQNAGLSNLHFKAGTAEITDQPPCALFSVIDVLYLIPFAEQEQLIAGMVKKLRPGGRLLLKEMSEKPRWKFLWNWFEEWLAVRVTRITLGSHFYFRTEAGWERLLREQGLIVQTIRIDRNYLHPHILFLGEKL